MNKLIISIIIGLLIFGVTILINTIKEENMEENKVYLGPVPEGYDEEHFRQTGETKPIEEKQ